MSDSGPQYAAETFRQFADKYGFIHVTRSSRYPQSNGEADRAVQTVKNILRKNEDPYLALQAHRNAPLQMDIVLLSNSWADSYAQLFLHMQIH